MYSAIFFDKVSIAFLNYSISHSNLSHSPRPHVGLRIQGTPGVGMLQSEAKPQLLGKDTDDANVHTVHQAILVYIQVGVTT